MSELSCENCNRHIDGDCFYGRSSKSIWHGTYCDYWVPTKSVESEWRNKEVRHTINILTAASECAQKQYDDVCSIGSNRCITCDFNCEQGTLKQRVNALQTAINALEKEMDKEK